MSHDNSKTLSLSELQKRLPWDSNNYSSSFHDADVLPHRYFAHALLHVYKAAGKLAAIVDKSDHAETSDALRQAWEEDFGKYIADLVICAARLANTGLPPVDLETAVRKRLEEKMGGLR